MASIGGRTTESCHTPPHHRKMARHQHGADIGTFRQGYRKWRKYRVALLYLGTLSLKRQRDRSTCSPLDSLLVSHTLSNCVQNAAIELRGHGQVVVRNTAARSWYCLSGHSTQYTHTFRSSQYTAQALFLTRFPHTEGLEKVGPAKA